MIWTYMGPDAANPPPLPNVEWNLVPQEQVHISAPRAGMQLAAGGRRGNRFRPCAVAAWPARCQREHKRMGSEAGPSPDLRMHQARFRDEHCCAAELRCEHTLLARQPVRAAILHAGATLSPFPDLSGHAWVPIDDENTLCIMFSYHPSQPLLPKTRQIFEEGHNGRESGHASRHSLVEHP